MQNYFNMKYITLLLFLASTILFNGCDPVSDNNNLLTKKNINVNITTDNTEFGLNEGKNANLTIVNNSDQSIFFNSYSKPPFASYLGIQRFEDDEWVFVDASKWITGDRSLNSLEIKHGESFGPDQVFLGPLLLQ